MKGTDNRFIVFLVGVAAVFVIIWGIQNSAAIINPLVLATIITIAALPLSRWFSSKGMGGTLSIILTIVVVIGALVLVAVIIFFSIAGLTKQLPTYIVNNETLEPTLDNLGLSASELDAAANRLLAAIGTTLLPILGSMLITFGWTILIFIFMISAAIALPKKSRQVFSADSKIFEQFNKFTEDIQRYVSVMTGVNFLVGLGDAIFLMILGVDYAILWGLLAWFLGYIPTVGFWIALIPPTLLAWAQYGIETALIVFLGYVLINGSVQNFVQPRMMGKGLSISPVVVFISLFVWGWLLGGVGALLAVPLTLTVLVVLENFESTRWMVILVHDTDNADEDERGEARGRLQGIVNRARGSLPGGSKNSAE